jgi:hypothetical protein
MRRRPECRLAARQSSGFYLSWAVAVLVFKGEVAFSPDRDATKLVVKIIGEARLSVDRTEATARYTVATLLAGVCVSTRVDFGYAARR